MELSKEFIETHKLSEDQVKGLTDFGKNYIADKQKEWDGRSNTEAEKIIEGAATYALKETGVKLERQQGEKYGDFLKRISVEAVKGSKSEIDRLKSEYETKLKEFKGGDALKSELDQVKVKYDEALQKYADYDQIKEKAAKADEYGQQLSGLKLEVAFNGIKPNFPDTVNKYEASAKWADFKAGVLKSGTIEIVDGKAIVIDKENQYKQTPLEDLISKDTSIQELMKGRQQQGPGGKPADLTEIEGVPFKLPKDADGPTRSKLIKEHLATQGIAGTHPQFAQKFKEINDNILKGKNLQVA